LIKLANVLCSSNKASSKKGSKKETEGSTEKIKEELIDRQELQDLIRELNNEGYKNAADTLEHFQYDVITTIAIPK
jgi:putative transposase